jgi:hypothetical protein
MPRFIAFHPARFLIVLVMLVLGLLLIFLLFQQTGFPAMEIGCPLGMDTALILLVSIAPSLDPTSSALKDMR